MWWILIGLSICMEVHGFSDGDFKESCKSMSPLHDSAPQSTPPPYSVHYKHGREGEPITVILSSNTNKKFSGFMLEARPKGMVDEGNPVGKFIPLNGETRLLNCNNMEGTAVSQRFNKDKTEIRVNWTAQGEDLDITFRATFVQLYDTFWERVDVNVTLPTPTPPPPPTTTPTPPPTTTPTPTPPPPPTTPPPTTTTPPPPTTTTTTTTTPTQASTKTSTAKPSTTTSTAVLSTTASAANSSTTASATKPSSTRTTAVPSTTRGTQANRVENAGTSLMASNIVFTAVKMELVNIFAITLTNSPFSRDLTKVSQILGGLLCATAEISTLILIFMDNSLKVTRISLVCVAIAMSFIELVIVALPIGPSHELKEICDAAVKVCSVICTIFTTAVVFLGVLETDGCLKNREESWLLKVMIAYTVWIFLSVIWTFVFSIHINTKLRRGSSKNRNGWTKTRKTKKLGAAEVIVTAVSVILIAGTVSFTAALIVGIFSEKQA